MLVEIAASHGVVTCCSILVALKFADAGGTGVPLGNAPPIRPAVSVLLHVGALLAFGGSRFGGGGNRFTIGREGVGGGECCNTGGKGCNVCSECCIIFNRLSQGSFFVGGGSSEVVRYLSNCTKVDA